MHKQVRGVDLEGLVEQATGQGKGRDVSAPIFSLPVENDRLDIFLE
jgi:hypothetical protein